jgi:hypothetical protein
MLCLLLVCVTYIVTINVRPAAPKVYVTINFHNNDEPEISESNEPAVATKVRYQ